MSSTGDFLIGLRVLEIGDGIAGASATSVLWSLGAEVTALIDPASPHRRTRPQVAAPSGSQSLLSVLLDRGKQVIAGTDRDADAVAQLIVDGGFDLVVADRVIAFRGPLAQLQDLTFYTQFVTRANPGAWLSISAFGLSGPRRDDIASELTVAAASGMLASVRDPDSGHPLKLAGHQSLLNTGQAAALASCHAVDLARAGQPAHLDLSAVESTIAMGPTLEIGAVTLNAGGPGGAKRYGAPASFYPCVDGMVRISAMEDHQWQGVVAAMGSPPWTEQFATTQTRIEGHDEIDRRIEEWTRTLTKADAEALLQSHGVPGTAMYSPAEILQSPQLHHRTSFDTITVPDGRQASVVGAVCRTTVTGTGVTPRRRSLRDLRVLEASHVLAAPLAGALLGALGADVSKLEDLQRIDMYRRRGPYIDGQAGGERSSYFALMNHSKSSVAFDVEAAPARLQSLLDETDVVIENLGGRRAARLGLSADLVNRHPQVLAVSSSGFGQDGPFASYRAYAYNLQASCGLGYLTRSEAGVPAEIDLPWADLISAYALATIVAAWAVGPAGNVGSGIDFAMADLIVSHFNEFVAAASLDANSDRTVDRANETAPFAPNGVYPAEDGWVALSVFDDEQFATLAKILDCAPLLAAEFVTGDVRFERRRALDALMNEATKSWQAAALATELRAAGIVAEQLIGPRQLPDVEQLVARDFFTAVEHPEWGRRRLIGLPWRPFGDAAIALGAPPRLVST